MRGELKLHSSASPCRERETQTDIGQTGSDHAIGLQPMEGTHDIHTQENEEEGCYMWANMSESNAFSTTPSCPLPSVWASALHNCFCVCWAGRMCASYSLLHCTHSGWQPMAKHCFITHLGHTKIFFFFWWLPLLFFPPLPPVFYYQQELEYQCGQYTLCLTDQLVFGFILVEFV